MTRVQLLLAGLAGLLLVVLFWLLLWSPQQDELEEVRADIEAAQQQQQQLAAQADQLRAVRDEAPELEAQLAAASSVVPTDPALPSALRQLQQASDEAGATLTAISPSRPSQVDGAPEGVSRIEVSVQLAGSYFQVVDFLRRVEDPTLTPRGLTWGELSVTRQEYPELSVSLSGRMFTRLPGPPVEQPEEETGEQDDDADVEIEVEENDDE
jgi:Tfp pilus assembly protein PilO